MATHELVSGTDAQCPRMIRVFHHPDAAVVAQPFADGFTLVEREQAPADIDGFFLWAADDRLELRHGRRRGGAWVTLSELKRRAARGSELRKAVGVAPGRAVLDAMAGWGVDGLLLAARGCRVTMVERHPAVAALIRDLMRRADVGGATCRCGDGYRALDAADGWDVVYLDPMFPERNKRALPGKRMQWLAELAGPDRRPLARWLEAARGCARERVVLKRRRRDPVIGPPDWQIRGRTVRYDIYRPFSAPAAPRSGSPDR